MNALHLWVLLSKEELSAITLLSFLLLTVILQDSDRTRSLAEPLVFVILALLVGSREGGGDG